MSVVVLELGLGEAAKSFQLEKAVCSHGFFMMPPNQWDPLSKSLLRPLRLDTTDSDSDSVLVRISQHSWAPQSLHVSVYGIHYPYSPTPQHRHSLLTQVSRMLRLSETEERAVREYRNMCKVDEDRSFDGRVFRSPTLFEDMVKCILLCNCQWPRTLSMARAICELQLELHTQSSHVLLSEAGSTEFKTPKSDNHNFIPNTPLLKDTKTKLKESHILADNIGEDDSFQNCKTCQAAEEPYNIGNFPGPTELAKLDESFLATRCNLGYRAIRILKLARAIVEGQIQLTQLEEESKGASLSQSSYNKLADQLKAIYGFGPFTCANVLMCMGVYHVIPTDSETIRHLRQEHARNSTVNTVERDVEHIYGKYAPFQFLAYWSELWHFYEKSFGKLSEMPCSDYKLITSSNMRSKRGTKKRKKKRE